VKKPRDRQNKKQASSAPKPPQVLLFDLNKDIGEQNNLAEDYPEIVNQLRERMEELNAEITANARAPWVRE
jgi:hypothetical protein